ncbi:TPA: VWA domain-containing protein, partial [Streptococcus pyogenes]|nr:VWA domain-containing protein [Streptococcus pyogenes]
MTNCKYKLRKLSVGLVSVGTMLIAPTVLGQEVNASGTSSTESSTTSTASASTDTSGTAASEAGSGASDASVVSSEGSQGSESAQASTQPQAQTAVAASASTTASPSSSEEKTPKTVTSSTSSTPAASSSSNGNQVTGTEAEPQMMDVEKYTVDKESSELKVKDGDKSKNGNSVTKDTKLIRNRDGEQRDIFDIKREVKTNSDGTIDVTVTVTPKEIDKGADVMALLDVSKKMSEEDFNNAKTKIKQLVKTLTEKNGENHNSRNSVRLMAFYREISDPIDISGKTDAELEKLLNELREKAKANYDWGVDLQGAIHKARTVFKNENNDNKKKSGKRQHIVLFSQGESTFSYDIKNKNDGTVTKRRITEKVTTSNPLLPWPPIFDHTHQNADMLDDIAKVIKKVKDLGVKSVGTADNVLSALKLLNGFNFLTGSMTEYITLKEYDSNKLEEKYFDYTKRVGEGYYYHSFSDRKSENKMPFETEIKTVLEQFLPKIEDREWAKKFIKIFGLQEREVNQIGVDVITKVIRSVFYKRQYHYYNHNLSAIAEAKMAQEEGITFYSVDVTDLNTARRVKRQTATYTDDKKKEIEKIEKERNNKFDDYLKKMSEDNNFLSNVEERDKFKDTLTELKIKDEFSDKVTVEENSWNKPVAAELKNSNKNSI